MRNRSGLLFAAPRWPFYACWMTAMIRVRPCEFAAIRSTSGESKGISSSPMIAAFSRRHAEINRRFENGEHRWYLKDMQSTNGTFVRAATVILGPRAGDLDRKPTLPLRDPSSSPMESAPSPCAYA